MALSYLYENACMGMQADDIYLHLPALRWLASWHDRVTEFGVRGGNSTVALLMGNPNVVSYDIDPCPREDVIRKNAPGWDFRIGDTLEIEIDETDLLFIDTLHTYEQLSAELARHGDKVTTTIALHDLHTIDRTWSDPEGMQQAVAEFTAESPWRVALDVEACNGLTVLCRSDS